MLNILVTGGAGFIGTNLVRRLLAEGESVTVLDNFSAQVHGGRRTLAPDIADHVRLIVGDICDHNAVSDALAGQDVIVHLAAETGTGQSMYCVRRYEQVNVGGTATLIECLAEMRPSRLFRVVVASSRAIYGEGRYLCQTCGIVYPRVRRTNGVTANSFDPLCPACGVACTPLPTDESTPCAPVSFYGLTKQMQEQMILLAGRTLGVSAIALRYQNVYGPGQSFANPYTGIMAIFAQLARSDQPIQVFEDGQESRDFVYIDDAVDATWRAITAPSRLPDESAIAALNVGSGERTTVLDAVCQIVTALGSRSAIEVTGTVRAGDIRHNVADLTAVSRVLGYAPAWRFAAGLPRFLAWAQEQPLDRGNAFSQSMDELRSRGLLWRLRDSTT